MSRILIFFIFIQFSSNVFANCVSLNNGVLFDQGLSDNNNSEYLIRLNSNTLTNKDLNFIRINIGSNECLGKTLILEINDDIIFNITGNKVNQYIGGIDEIRLYADINIVVNNQDQQGITRINFEVPEVKIVNDNIKIYLKDNHSIGKINLTDNINALYLIFQKLTILENADLNLEIIGIRPLLGGGTNAGLKINTIENNGNLFIKIIGGSGSRHVSQMSLYVAYVANGGEVYDFNINKLINNGNFKLYELGGSAGRLRYSTGRLRFGKAGNIGSVNIDNLYNTSPDFEIKTELNEKDVDNLSSVNCGCSDDCGSATDPTIGDINIKYLASGSFLPKKLEIIKAVPVNETKINIEGCHVNSLGNSEISYVADDLILRLANVGTIQNDFDNNSYHIGDILVEERICPVCDSLELNNFALRTDIEYTIYTDQGTENITDLNIYYVNPDGSLFKPPGYPSNKDYVIYSLKTGETITPKQNQFIGTNIKEYKIAKEKLHYNSENFDLTNIPIKKGYDTQDVRLFCQAQRYLLRFRLQSQADIKEIYFTPLFDIK